MRGQGDIRQGQKRPVDRHRFHRKGLQHRAAQMTLGQGMGQRVIVAQGAPRGVDEQRTGLHPREGLGVHHPRCFRRDAGVHRHNVAFRDQPVEGDQLHPRRRILGRKLDIGVMHQDLRAEGPQKPHHLGPDIAIADDAHRHLAQFATRHVRAVKIATPLARAQCLVAHTDLPCLGQDRAQRELGHRAGVAARRVDHHHPMVARRSHVDVDRPPARHRDQLQLRQPLQHAPRHRRKLGDQDLGIAHELHHPVGTAEILLQTIHARNGIAMFHRLVRPVVLAGPDRQRIAAGGTQLGLEDLGQHEMVADDRDGSGHWVGSCAKAWAFQIGSSARRAAR